MKKKYFKLIIINLILFVLLFLLIFYDNNTKAQSSTLENELYKIVPDSKTGMINILIKRLNTYALYYSVPSSSKILIKYDNFQYMLESTGSVKQDFTLKGNTLFFHWATKFLSLTQTIEFIKIDEFNTGIQVKIEVTNLDIKGHFIAIGLIFDTYFGENYNKPFQISNLGIIDSEQYFVKSSIPLNIFSLDNPNNPVVGLVFYPRRAGITPPDKVIIANYDELLNNFWNFTYVRGRSFNSTYKRLDAAVGYIYDESFVNSNQVKSVSYILGFYPLYSSSVPVKIEQGKNDETSEKVYPEDVDSKINELKNYLEQQIKTLNEKIDQLKKKYENIQQMDNSFFSGQQLMLSLLDLLTEINALEAQIHELDDEQFNQLYMNLLNKLEELLQKLNELIYTSN
ncbi:MAG: hypothetical protein ACK4YF_05795 [Exilispira sp.]